MAANPRPTLSTSPKPTMIFPNIPGATLYQFTMIKPDGETLWEKEVNSSDSDLMDTEDGYYKYDYPYHEFPLERIGIYLITGETTDGKSDFRGQAEVLFRYFSQKLRAPFAKKPTASRFNPGVRSCCQTTVCC